MSPAITPEQRYARMAKQLLDNPGVTRSSDLPRSKRFGSAELMVNNKIFAILVKGRLVVKLPRQRVEELIAAKQGERFDPGHGRLMKEWITVDPSATEKWLRLAKEAMQYVASKR
jgi:TfoX/Sxy family transcriptional regulator of competence genes